MTSLHQLKRKKDILLFVVLFIFTIESCQNQQTNKINPLGDTVFEDFKEFPNKPFIQMSFTNNALDNESILLNSGFVSLYNDSYYRAKDSTTIFYDQSFDNFTVYLKSQKFLKQSQLLYDLIESHSLKLKGTPIFTEFKIELPNRDKYSLTFFKTITFIRLKYELLNPKG